MYNNLCNPEEIRKMGKKSQIEEITSKGERIDRNQFTYIMQHDNGFAFLFENLEKHKKLLIKLNLTIENLIDPEIQQEGAISDSLEWRVTLEPGKFKVKELKIADITNRTSLKYSFNFKNYATPELLDQDTLIDLCKESGTKYQVDFDGKNYQIFYFSYVYNDKQYWAFINEEPAKVFDG